MNNIQQYLLGIDYGTKYIGLAIGQAITYTASPIAVLKNSLEPQITYKQIDKIINVWSPGKIILGYPEELSSNKILPDLDKLCSYLNLQYPDIILVKVSEHLSTRAAQWQLQNKSKKYNDSYRIDAYAACLILESWLSTENTYNSSIE